MSPWTMVRHAGAIALASALVARAASAQTGLVLPPRPTVPPPAPYSYPKVSTQTLPNGLRLAVVENHTVPIVAVRVGFAAGPAVDLPGKEGGWVVMMNSLREGTSTRSPNEMTDALADLGTSIKYPTGAGPTAPVAFTTTRTVWQPVLDLVADMLVHPTFPADGFKRQQSAIALAANQVIARDRAIRILNAQLFGPEHPTARYATDSSVRRLTLDDIVALQTTYLRPQNATIVIVGDVTPGEARAAVDRAFGGWERGGTSVGPEMPPPSAQIPTTIFISDQPNAPQTMIVTGLLLPSRMTPDAPAFELIDAMLGGASGGSRLVHAFRLERGLTYSSSTSPVWRPEPQPATWQAIISVARGVTDTAVVEWLRIVREARGTRPLTSAELEFSRQNLIGGIQVGAASVEAVSVRTTAVLQNRLPEAFYTDYARRMASVTLAEVQAATKYFDADHLVIVVVGDRAKIEAPLRATGIPVVIVP